MANIEAPKTKMTFEKELEFLLNRYSIENHSNTADWILADYLKNCLRIFEIAIKNRDNWYGGRQSILEDERGKRWDVPATI